MQRAALTHSEGWRNDNGAWGACHSGCDSSGVGKAGVPRRGRSAFHTESYNLDRRAGFALSISLLHTARPAESCTLATLGSAPETMIADRSDQCDFSALTASPGYRVGHRAVVLRQRCQFSGHTPLTRHQTRSSAFDRRHLFLGDPAELQKAVRPLAPTQTLHISSISFQCPISKDTSQFCGEHRTQPMLSPTANKAARGP